MPSYERKTEGRKVPATNFMKLIDKIGHSEVTELMGVGVGTTHHWYRAGMVGRAYEDLASRILMDDQSSGPPVMLAVKVQKDKLDMVKTFLKGAECQFMEWRF